MNIFDFLEEEKIAVIVAYSVDAIISARAARAPRSLADS
jgi:hypothetical protein